jgi:hypothetical protein
MVMEGGMHALHVAPRQTGSTQQPLQLAVMLSAVPHSTRPTCNVAHTAFCGGRAGG